MDRIFRERLRQRTSSVRAFFVTFRSVLSVSPGAVSSITPVFELFSSSYVPSVRKTYGIYIKIVTKV